MLSCENKAKKAYKVKMVRANNVIEFSVVIDGHPVEGVLGRGERYNWLALPKRGKSCELACFNDTFWNSESMSYIIEDYELVCKLAEVIRDIMSTDLNFEYL